MFTNDFEYIFFSLKESIKKKDENIKEKDQKLTEAKKLEGGVEISQKAVERIRKDAVDDYTKDMLRNVVKKEFECSGCKNLPRPYQITMKKCKTCSKIFCDFCGSHQCSDGGQRNPDMTVPLKIDLDFLPYFCKNNKFGCQEILLKKAELFEHEYVCEFQLTYCADNLCKSEVNILNYLDHYKEKHGNYDDMGEGKTFKLPLPMDQIQSQTLLVTLRNDVLAIQGECHGTYQLFDTVNGKPSWIMGSRAIWYNNEQKFWSIGLKCHLGQNRGYFFALYVSGGPDNSSNIWKYFNDNSSGDKWVTTDINDISIQCAAEKAIDGKWSPKQFTAFERTFFDVSFIRNNTIYKWVYILALPDVAKNFQVQITVEDAKGRTVIDYTEQVRSVVECHDFIIENEDCFALSVKKAKKYAMRDTNQVDYNIKIRNLKDEAKDDDEESGIDD